MKADRPLPPPSFSPPPDPRAKIKPAVRPPTIDERLSWLAEELSEHFPHLEIKLYLNRLAVRDPRRGTAAILAWEYGRWSVIGGNIKGQFRLLNGTFDDPYEAIAVFVNRLGLNIDPLWLFTKMFPGVVK